MSSVANHGCADVAETKKSRDDLPRDEAGLRRRIALLERQLADAVRSEAIVPPSGGVVGEIGQRPQPPQTRLLRKIVANVPIVVWAVDADGRFMLSEGKGLTALGLKPGEVVGRPVAEVYRDVPEIISCTQRALEGESLTAIAAVNGVLFEAWYSPLRDRAGQIVGVAGVAIDVTQREQARKELLAGQRVMRTMLRSHERDRQLIAYEIHDGLVQHVTGAQMRLETILGAEQAREGQNRRELEEVLGLVRKAIAEARDLIRGLRPPILDEWGVVAAINYLIEDQPADGPSIEFAHQMPLVRLEPLLEGTIYRIVQEAITNVKRHSKSQRALIRLVQQEDRIRLEIRDWGVGFHPAEVGRSRFGLEGIRERARLLHGRASIQSSPGRGTRILVDLPVAGAPEQQELVNTKDRSSE